jgi:hypothetical protein
MEIKCPSLLQAIYNIIDPNNLPAVGFKVKWLKTTYTGLDSTFSVTDGNGQASVNWTISPAIADSAILISVYDNQNNLKCSATIQTKESKNVLAIDGTYDLVTLRGIPVGNVGGVAQGFGSSVRITRGYATVSGGQINTAVYFKYIDPGYDSTEVLALAGKVSSNYVGQLGNPINSPYHDPSFTPCVGSPGLQSWGYCSLIPPGQLYGFGNFSSLSTDGKLLTSGADGQSVWLKR